MTEITGLAELLLARIAETRAAAVGLSPMESPGAPEPVEAASPRPRRYSQCDGTCTVDCGHCKGAGPATVCVRLDGLEGKIAAKLEETIWPDGASWADISRSLVALLQSLAVQ